MSSNETAASTEIDLLRRISSKDQNAVGELYDKYASVLFSLLIRILRSQEEAEDTLQEVFLRVWEKSSSYNPSLGGPGVWLTRIARNLAIDKLRSKLGHARKAEDDLMKHSSLRAEERGADPEQHTVHMQQSRSIREALAALPQEQRILIESAYFEGYTQSELAQRFALPLGTVKTRMRTGMTTLRRLLHDTDL